MDFRPRRGSAGDDARLDPLDVDESAEPSIMKRLVDLESLYGVRDGFMYCMSSHLLKLPKPVGFGGAGEGVSDFTSGERSFESGE